MNNIKLLESVKKVMDFSIKRNGFDKILEKVSFNIINLVYYVNYVRIFYINEVSLYGCKYLVKHFN